MQDDKINIAVGMSARSRKWKNENWTWSKLSEKLLTEHKTNETYKEFINATKQEQSKIKDVGGYVGGYLRGGRRKPENVGHRQLLTLDIDNANSSFWFNFQMMFGNAAVLHSTHKHSPESPRYRLVMPLSREASPDEYVATARYVAGLLGIDNFDNTTFQAERLMFWPSSSKDAEYFAEAQEGPWLDVDAALDTYIDWTDSSLWPTSEATIREVKDASSKQQDPEEKRGVIGAFCRSYTISEVIETLLTEEYVEATEGRYTYTKGTAAAGLVIYDDKFAYSHHGTDPCSGKLCNAFDLVRVHKFGHLDENQRKDDIKGKSFAAMEEFCRNDERVKQTIAEERLTETRYDFADDVLEEFEEEEIDIEWAKELELDGKGKYLSSAGNISLIFSNDPALKGCFFDNIFDDKKYVMRSLPWRKISAPESIKNVDFSGVRNYIESVYGITGVSKIEDALNLEFQKNQYHPVKEYLDSLSWDGTSRIDDLLIDYFGAVDNIYSREAIRKMLVGAVARIYNPGCKFDLVLTLVGKKQGTGKSTFINKLGREWFSDSFHTVSGKESFEQLHGAWLIEMAELSGVRKSEVEAIKHFITKREDNYRPAYGRIVETFKRKCVFFATTNEKEFLRDVTGNRRFMPIDVVEERATKKVLDDDQLVGEQIDQIWAEAVAAYNSGEKLYLSAEAEEIAREEQKSHSQVDDRQGLVEEYLNTPIPEDWHKMDLYDRRNYLQNPKSDNYKEVEKVQRQTICIAAIWCECLGREKSDMSRYNTKELNDMLRGLDDWEQLNKSKRFSLYGKQKYYSRIK